MTDLASVREELETKRRQLHHRLTKIRADIQRHQGPLDPNRSEQATELENAEVLDKLEISTRHELELVTWAVARIDAGTYGECAECGDPIAPRRLEAMPFAVLCVACATLAETA